MPVSSIIHASKVTFPSLSGRPPNPTDIISGSASDTLTPDSTASIALPPLTKIFIAALLAAIPCSHVDITIGNPNLEFEFCFSFFAEIIFGKIAVPIAPKTLPFINVLLFDIKLYFVISYTAKIIIFE